MQLLREMYLFKFMYSYYDEVRLLRLSGQVVRRRSRKPKIAGSNPVWASLLYAFFSFFIGSLPTYTFNAPYTYWRRKEKNYLFAIFVAITFVILEYYFRHQVLTVHGTMSSKYHWSKKINECREFTVLHCYNSIFHRTESVTSSTEA